MSHYLPPAIMAFFQPRPVLDFKLPPQKKECLPLTGIGQFMHRMKEYEETIPLPVKNKTPQEIQAARKIKYTALAVTRLEKHKAKWNPKEKEGLTGDAFKTLFVARLSYDVTEEDLKHEFEYYGPIANVGLIADKKGKSRGYGFVEFQSSKDLKEAYNDADGRKIGGRRIVVDVERGRTVKNWLPRRLGGGLGGTRIGGKDENQRYSGREPPASGASSSSRSSRSSRSDRSDRDRDRGGDRDRESSRSDRDRDRSRRSDKDRDRDRESGRRRNRDEDEGDKDRDRKRSRRDSSRERT